MPSHILVRGVGFPGILPARVYPVFLESSTEMTNVRQMSVDELDAALGDVCRRRNRALRDARSAEEIGALEACQAAIANELRRRGL